jgi:uncharacterized protein (DUF1330 family)
LIGIIFFYVAVGAAVGIPPVREERESMLRVVDIRPSKETMKVWGLAEKDIRVDPDTYRHYVEQFNHNFAEFGRNLKQNGPVDGDAATIPEEGDAAADEELLVAFERSQAPFSYYRGGIYRYRVDRSGNTDRPIILESFERSEITGDFGIYGFSARKGLLMPIVRRIERWLNRRREID